MNTFDTAAFAQAAHYRRRIRAVMNWLARRAGARRPDGPAADDMRRLLAMYAAVLAVIERHADQPATIAPAAIPLMPASSIRPTGWAGAIAVAAEPER